MFFFRDHLPEAVAAFARNRYLPRFERWGKQSLHWDCCFIPTDTVGKFLTPRHCLKHYLFFSMKQTSMTLSFCWDSKSLLLVSSCVWLPGREWILWCWRSSPMLLDPFHYQVATIDWIFFRAMRKALALRRFQRTALDKRSFRKPGPKWDFAETEMNMCERIYCKKNAYLMLLMEEILHHHWCKTNL